ncbi:hypothetical protein GGQ63_002613 [Prosthecomicrobium pneumaticum]|uniref:Uncharacterized protein n=1 Tax=Prosthecomicrobium pneumaticum TaxID=81895 RepID=A0A7W9FMW8_9HYPH|nr:hypothetical protein [Prosthecomicrobium pneumaticum]
MISTMPSASTPPPVLVILVQHAFVRGLIATEK